eukprot:1156915-Pelagomonas_calceolata.AAC.2
MGAPPARAGLSGNDPASRPMKVTVLLNTPKLACICCTAVAEPELQSRQKHAAQRLKARCYGV